MKSIRLRTIARKLLNYFLQGLLFLLPIVACIYAFIWVFDSIDSILPFFKDNPNTLDVNERIPGATFTIVITFTILVGFLGNVIFGQTILSFIDSVLERTPGVKFLYNLIKDFMEAFVGDKRKFTEPVMFEMQEGIYKLGFLTQRDLKHFDMLEFCGVYCPKSYGMMGDLIIVRRDKIKKLDKNATQVMTFIVSGGVTDFE
jgi:uncharacterized membrane protein